MSQGPRHPDPSHQPADGDGFAHWRPDLLEEGPELPPENAGSLMTSREGWRTSAVGSLGNSDQALVSTQAFESMQLPLMEIIHLLGAVEQRMETLKDRFNESMPKSLLRMRPWPRRKGEPPYALYWIFFRRRRRQFDSSTFQMLEDRKPRRFRRLKIRTRADLSHFVHLARLDVYRKDVFVFHDRALALNEAHRILARSLDSVRKMIGGREIYVYRDVPPLDDARFGGLPQRYFDRLGQLWRLGWAVREASDDLRDCERRHREMCPRSRHRLHYLEDSEHPYGRLLWRDELSRVSYSSLPDRHRRQLHISRQDVWPVFELDRRELTQKLHKLTKLVKRIRLKLGYALKTGRAAFDRGLPPASNPYKEAL